MAVEISQDAQSILSGATPEAVSYVTKNAPGKKITSGEAQRLLSQFQATNSYTGQNVANAIAGAVPTYNYADPYGAYASIGERLGLTGATTEEQKASEALKTFQTGTQAQINALRANRDLSTGLEAGFEAQRTREATQQEQVLANELALRQNARMALEGKVEREYGIYQGERAKREELLLNAIQAGSKNVNIGMTTEELTKAYTKASEEKAKEAEKKAYKDGLKSKLLELGISTSGNTKELEKRLKKAIKSSNEYDAFLKSLDVEAKQLSIAKTKKDLAGGSGDNEYEKTEKELYGDVDNWKQKMREGKANWSDAWSSIQRKYGLSTDMIDSLLGLDYRDKYDKELE